MADFLNIIVVEDSEDDAEFILEEIGQAGFEITSIRVASADALEAALLEHDWDLVLSDNSMPGFNPPAALSVLHDSGVDIPFIIVSGFIAEGTAVSALRAGAHDFVMKDRLDRLVPAIERELADADTRRQVLRATHDQGQSSPRSGDEHSEPEGSPVDLGALNRLFQQHMAEIDQAEIENQTSLRYLGTMILRAVEERHRNGRLPESAPALSQSSADQPKGGQGEDPA